MDTMICALRDGTRLILMTDSPASHYGIPAVRHEGCPCASDYGPGDVAPACICSPHAKGYFGPQTMATMVEALATDAALESDALRAWIGQAPDGVDSLRRTIERRAMARGEG